MERYGSDNISDCERPPSQHGDHTTHYHYLTQVQRYTHLYLLYHLVKFSLHFIAALNKSTALHWMVKVEPLMVERLGPCVCFHFTAYNLRPQSDHECGEI